MQAKLQQSRGREGATSTLLGAVIPNLTDEERRAIRDLPVIHRFLGRSRLLLKEGEQVARIQILCKGWAIRARWLDDERRQVLDFILPGEIIGQHVDGTGASICDVMALTACEVGEIGIDDLERVAVRNPRVALGLYQSLQRQIAQANDQITRLGRMTAYERVCSFLIDIHMRQRSSSTLGGPVDLPVTQAVVADLLGLSVVHVNRQIMRLRREGLVKLTRRSLTILDENRLAAIARHREGRFTPLAPMVFAAE